MQLSLTRTLAMAIGLLGTQSVAFADAPEWFSIKRIVHAGSGCAAGTVAENVSPDKQAFTLVFDSYVAEAGPGVPMSAGRKNCQLNLEFDCPTGWAFALVDLDSRGYAALDPNVRGLQKTTFYFQGDAQQNSFERTFSGPIDTDYQVRDTLAVSARRFGQCGRTARSLNINTQVRLDTSRNRAGYGIMTVDSVDGSLFQEFGVVWQRTSF